ncbi:MAG: GntR family transcriptional regulator [Planctomycetota bacterium]|nr:GntR family transcriptional regulator [Planctomycetota bacterium]MDA1141677.1 GntR family transcriptional regulator [Planctomycetota bacterium]
MQLTRETNVNYSDQVFEVLQDEISSGLLAPGSKMPSIRELSQRFRISVFPIRQAVERLEAQGYVVRRHGSGTYVKDRPVELKMSNSAVLCMPATGHLYGDMTRLLLDQLHDVGLFASVLDTSHSDAGDLLARALYSDARFLITHAGGGFPFSALESGIPDGKHLLAVISWESSTHRDCVHRILVNHVAGSRLIAEHLWSAGHRHALVAGPENMIKSSGAWEGKGACPPELHVQGAGFAPEWLQRGGKLTNLPTRHEAATCCDEEHLLAILNKSDPPTAIFGLRDVDAWDVKTLLHTLQPDALDHLTFIGNGDTPWSQAAHPPFSTLNWNLEKVAAHASRLIRRIMDGKAPKSPVFEKVAPTLVLRGK